MSRLITSPTSTLRQLALISLLGLTVPVMAAPAAAPASAHTEQAPGFFRTRVGTTTVTALYDGQIALAPGLLKGLAADSVQALQAKGFQSAEPGIQTAVNAFLVDTGERRVLVDAGAAKCFGPTMGNIVVNIRAAGYEPADIDTVLLTHMHPDHICGLVDADGKAVFANATVWAAKEDADFWFDAATTKAADDAIRPFFVMAQQAVAPYQKAGQFRTFGAGDTLVSGFSAVPTPGHTPGHTSYHLQSGQDNLLIWGDIIHAHAVQLQHPEVSIEFDVNAQDAIQSRLSVLKQTADQRWTVAGAHMPFPGIGHIRKDPDAYRWVPVEFGPVAQ